MNEHEIEPTTNNSYMPNSKFSFLASSNVASTNDVYNCIYNNMKNEVVCDSDGFIVNVLFASKEEWQARLYRFAL